jgi:putative transposase
VGDVKVVMHRPIEGNIKTVTIQCSASKWYACFSCEVEPQPLPPSPEVVGLDLGLKTFAVLSTGDPIKRQRRMWRGLSARKNHTPNGAKW